MLLRKRDTRAVADARPRQSRQSRQSDPWGESLHSVSANWTRRVVQSSGHFSSYTVTFRSASRRRRVRDDAAMVACWLELEEETTKW